MTRGKKAINARSEDPAQTVLERLYQRDYPTPYFVCPVEVDVPLEDSFGDLSIALVIDRIGDDVHPNTREDYDDFVFTTTARVGTGLDDVRFPITITIPYGEALIERARIKISPEMFRVIRSTTMP